MTVERSVESGLRWQVEDHRGKSLPFQEAQIALDSALRVAAQQSPLHQHKYGQYLWVTEYGLESAALHSGATPRYV